MNAPKDGQDFVVPIGNQDFLSADGKTARSSNGEFFSVGETVGHQGADNLAVIERFEPVLDRNEIRVYTNKGYAALAFLVKAAGTWTNQADPRHTEWSGD